MSTRSIFCKDSGILFAQALEEFEFPRPSVSGKEACMAYWLVGCIIYFIVVALVLSILKRFVHSEREDYDDDHQVQSSVSSSTEPEHFLGPISRTDFKT